jgi:hypothetical protein
MLTFAIVTITKLVRLIAAVLKNNHKNMISMKTTIYIITTLLTFSFNTLMASGESAPASIITDTELAPAIPVEATFEESVPDQDYTFRLALKVLAPVTPQEADFQEEIVATEPFNTDLAPTTPETAEFEDSI